MVYGYIVSPRRTKAILCSGNLAHLISNSKRYAIVPSSSNQIFILYRVLTVGGFCLLILWEVVTTDIRSPSISKGKYLFLLFDLILFNFTKRIMLIWGADNEY